MTITHTTKAAAVVALPEYGHGRPLAIGDARSLVFELLFTNGSSWEWHDATSSVQGVELTRGSGAFGATVQAGHGTIDLESTNHEFAPWHSYDHRSHSFAGKGDEFGPGVVWRLGVASGQLVGSPPTFATWEPIMTGVVESWEEATDANGRDVIARLTVTDTYPHLAGEYNTADIVVGGTVPVVYAAILFASGWQFGTVYHGPVAGGGQDALIAGPVPYSGSYAGAFRLLGDSVGAETYADRHGRLRFIPLVEHTLYTPANAGSLPTRPTLAVRTSELPGDTVRPVADLDPVLNDISWTTADGLNTQAATSAVWIAAYGKRAQVRTDVLSAVLLPYIVPAIIGRRQSLVDQIGTIELDDTDHLDELVATDIGSPVELIHAPPTATVAAVYGNASNDEAWIRSIRHRIHPLNDSEISWTATYGVDAYSLTTATGYTRRTAAGDRRRTAGADLRLTPLENLRA